MNYFKAIFVDIDGVLVENQADKISPLVANAIRHALTKFHISLCTGRNLQDALEIITASGLEGQYHVCESGTKVYAPGLKLEYIKELDRKDFAEILSITEAVRDSYGIAQNGRWLDSLAEVDDSLPITILSINSKTPEQTEQLWNLLQKYNQDYHIGRGSHHIYSTGAVIHITQKDANKAFGVRHIQNKLGISKKDSVAVGDMPMDFSFFKECAFSIVPATAHPEVLQKANLIVPSVSENGFVKALEYLMELTD